MSWVNAAPEYVAAAANDLAGIASTLSAANSAAAFPTSGVLPAGADEVSAGIAALFGAHAQAYQMLSSQAVAFHEQFVQLMTAGANQYDSAEARNSTPMGDAAAAINAPAAALPGMAVGGSSAGGSTPAAAGGEQVLARTQSGTLVQIGNGAGAASGVSAASAGGASGVVASGGGSAGAAGLLPGLRYAGVGAGSDVPQVSALPGAAIVGPLDGVGENTGDLAGVSPLVFGQGGANGLSSSAAPAAAVASPGAAGEGNSQAENGGGIAVHSGWLGGEASENGALLGHSAPAPTDQFASGEGSFYSRGGGQGGFLGGGEQLGAAAAPAEGAAEGA
ncbi:hypothetical protein A5645_11130 [Mycobacterium asiaticum]|uniref:PE family protein n=1 Tax=Mycobacterium asiaticum TaxID=1790 RepID=UPI0007EF3BC2|nr:PE family protein [Mycobacterium asiaticum]OBK95777.1 hypothetical protein A5645_11130 [Mycobacterium asiaticum]